MKREDAVLVSEQEAIELNTIDDVIRYLMKCNSLGLNIYCLHNGEKLYACDGYTYDEYYLLAMGIKPKDQAHLEAIVYGEDRLLEDKIILSDLITPIYAHLKEMYKPIRDQLREGKQKAK